MRSASLAAGGQMWLTFVSALVGSGISRSLERMAVGFSARA